MKKLAYILLCAVGVLFCSSCAKPDEDFVHDDASISAIYMQTTQKDATGKQLSLSIQGVINEESGEISFVVPKDKRKQIDFTAVKIRATVAYDAFVSVTKEGGKAVDRTLYGIHDISAGIELTVTANMTGRTKNYTLTAQYLK